jgi:hypothetical protein
VEPGAAVPCAAVGLSGHSDMESSQQAPVLLSPSSRAATIAVVYAVGLAVGLGLMAHYMWSTHLLGAFSAGFIVGQLGGARVVWEEKVGHVRGVCVEANRCVCCPEMDCSGELQGARAEMLCEEAGCGASELRKQKQRCFGCAPGCTNGGAV